MLLINPTTRNSLISYYESLGFDIVKYSLDSRACKAILPTDWKVVREGVFKKIFVDAENHVRFIINREFGGLYFPHECLPTDTNIYSFSGIHYMIDRNQKTAVAIYANNGATVFDELIIGDDKYVVSEVAPEVLEAQNLTSCCSTDSVLINLAFSGHHVFFRE
jgi:hypothetical protein